MVTEQEVDKAHKIIDTMISDINIIDDYYIMIPAYILAIKYIAERNILYDNVTIKEMDIFLHNIIENIISQIKKDNENILKKD